MGAYSDPDQWTETSLRAELAEWRAARKTAIMGGIAVIAGEGRRLEYSRAQLPAIDCEIKEILAEMRRRGLIAGNIGAIAVEIGHG
jgi:hypothetical protein